jgi:hypothetical protein
MARRIKLDTAQPIVNDDQFSGIVINAFPGRLDPIAMQQQAKYRKSGLTYISNDTSIIPRDEAGNIIMNEGSETNPLLIIDPVTEKVTLKSMLRVLNTRFEYYKFPVQVLPSGSLDLDVNLNLDQDLVYARYKPSENFEISSAGIASGILIDEIVEGLSQQNTNAYYISKDLKNSGKSLRFRIKIQHRYDGSGIGSSYFYISRNGPEKDLQREYLGPYAASSETNPYEAALVGSIDEPGLINTIIGQIISWTNETINIASSANDTDTVEWFTYIQSLVPPPNQTQSGTRFSPQLRSVLNSINSEFQLTQLQKNEIDSLLTFYDANVRSSDAIDTGFGLIGQYEIQNTYIDVIIPNSEFAYGDFFGITAVAGQASHTINSEQTYWVITDSSKTVDLWNQPITV